ncbi:MAG: SPFH domain-containing protein [Ruminococcus sp.]|nr:SPFH domain-containing protein [Ruminococcus sp.]
MGLIKMAVQAVSTNLKDQVVDYFRCDGMTQDYMAKPATKIVRGSAVNNASDLVITNGSVFDVAVGQAAVLVENGKVHDFVIADTEQTTGQYRYDSTVEPSLLGGGFKDFIPSLKNIGHRFTAGGQSTNTMRLVYINIKPLTDNPVGFGNIPFRDGETRITVNAQGHGAFEFQIKNPIAFYENVIMNPDKALTRSSDDGSKIISMMKNEMKPKFQIALTQISAKMIPYDQIGAYPDELAAEMNKQLEQQWLEKRGIVLTSLAIELNIDDESKDKISKFQEAAAAQNNGLLYAMDRMSINKAREAAAENEGGAMAGFMGMGFAGGTMSQPMEAPSGNAPQGSISAVYNAQTAGATQQTAPESWTCECGKTGNTGKFCAECGKPKPQNGWTCECGALNKDKFCTECGKKKPVGEPLYRCDKCGWEPEDPKNPPKFCPQCGDPFGDEDKIQ